MSVLQLPEAKKQENADIQGICNHWLTIFDKVRTQVGSEHPPVSL